MPTFENQNFTYEPLTRFWPHFGRKHPKEIPRIRMFHFDYFTNLQKKNPQNTLLWLQTARKGISCPTHIYSQAHQKKKGIWISSFHLNPRASLFLFVSFIFLSRWDVQAEAKGFLLDFIFFDFFLFVASLCPFEIRQWQQIWRSGFQNLWGF